MAHAAVFARRALGTVGRLLVTVVACFGLFALLPALHSLFGTPLAQNQAATSRTSIIMETRVRNREKKQVPQRRQRSVRSRASTSGNRTASMKFTPDLDVSAGGGVAVEDVDLESMVFEEGETDEPAVPLSRTTIPFPRRAVEMGIEGTVVFDITVGRNGRVERVDFRQLPHPVFRKSVMNAVRRWRFRPAKNQGIPVRVRLRQSIEFKLE